MKLTHVACACVTSALVVTLALALAGCSSDGSEPDTSYGEYAMQGKTDSCDCICGSFAKNGQVGQVQSDGGGQGQAGQASQGQSGQSQSGQGQGTPQAGQNPSQGSGGSGSAGGSSDAGSQGPGAGNSAQADAGCVCNCATGGPLDGGAEGSSGQNGKQPSP